MFVTLFTLLKIVLPADTKDLLSERVARVKEKLTPSEHQKLHEKNLAHVLPKRSLQ